MRNYSEILEQEMLVAVRIKQERGPDQDFIQFATIYPASGEEIILPLVWQSMAHKRAIFDRVRDLCRLMDAEAVVATHDVRMFRADAAGCSALGIPAPGKVSPVEFQRRYLDALDRKFGGLLENVPRHLIEEQLLVSAYGPRVKEIRMVSYTVVDGRLVFGEVKDTKGMEFNIGTIRAWWD